MGAKTKIIWVILIPLVFFGCEIATTPPPNIRIERVETSEWAGVTIYFDHHYQKSSNGTHYVTLNSPEEVAAYKEQVEFLLSRLEEVELRMNVHEPPLEPVVE